MTVRTYKMIALLVGLVLVATGISPTTTIAGVNKNAGTSSFPFLKINIGARAVAMGGAFTGLADDESALYYNPAGIIGFEEDRFMLGYHNYFVDIQSGMAGYIKRLGENKTMGISLNYLNYGTFTETNGIGQVLGEFGGSDIALGVSFATHLTYSIAVGGTAKVLYSKLQSFSATGAAIDLGAKWFSARKRYTAGLMIQNLGKQFSDFGDSATYSLPLTVRLGGSARPRGLPFTLAADIIVPTDNDIDFAIGVEYFKVKPAYLRIGFNSFGSNYKAANSESSLSGISLGFGYDIKKSLHLSYAFTPGADLGESHRITINGRI